MGGLELSKKFCAAAAAISADWQARRGGESVNTVRPFITHQGENGGHGADGDPTIVRQFAVKEAKKKATNAE